ncbi:efflux RND transporter periplasmic adaptor subunit [Sandaracinus amylolyticus]|uniref:Cobalt/zinc/cadmium efflux RND transporter, membrane fusion protein, CzcB family n=1 Tax=Sandaracinus amylolyticus TaxID=927083 RepID=A0A0F6SE29_9BACT|nr:efflux RND transporter periplasmic adaptor subunit [Sandaracinus amylolyticus]AKF04474.1 Cobalt/zinc/cadmium efflux RND transporter, membrane fusion protein, CzcB family [Sandaracinus amylolyticus]
MTARAAVWLLCAASLGCGGGEAGERHEDEHEHEAHGDEHEADEGHGEAEEGVLVIDRSMLRDLRLTTSPVEARAGGEMVTALAELQTDPDRSTDVAPLLEARIERVLVNVGDRVEEGQPLAHVVSLGAAPLRADVSAASARVQLAESTLARRRALAEERIVPAREVQESEAELAQARAALAAASGAARGVRGGPRGQVVLTSPRAGIVLARDAIVGAVVEPGHVLFRVADISELWVVAHVFERDAVRIERGAPVRVSLAARPGAALDASVTRVGTQVDTRSRTLDIVTALSNADGTLRPGMAATASIAIGERDDRLLAVPSGALQRLAEGWVVFVPRGEGRFEAREVGRGRDFGGEVEIVSGLTEGESVVVDGAFLLKAEAERAQGGGDEHHHH